MSSSVWFCHTASCYGIQQYFFFRGRTLYLQRSYGRVIPLLCFEYKGYYRALVNYNDHFQQKLILLKLLH